MLRTTVKKQNVQKYKKNIKAHLTAKKPFKPLTRKYNSKYGRNFTGQIVVRHKERGVKKIMRIIAFVRKYRDIAGIVQTVEYCPKRTAFIALIKYTITQESAETFAHEYILHPKGLKVGDTVMFSDQEVKVTPGSCTTLSNIPQGELVHNIEYRPGKGGQIARSAGCYATLVDHVDAYAILKLASGFMIKVKQTCYACMGEVSNAQHNTILKYKAGQNRKLGWRPEVRGVAMNKDAHPHGGGEGRTGTKRHPVSYTSKLTKGMRTRGKRSILNKNIISRKKK